MCPVSIKFYKIFIKYQKLFNRVNYGTPLNNDSIAMAKSADEIVALTLCNIYCKIICV